MDKLKANLEKNVEWIALGLAGLWVLWLIWAYGIQTPVYVEIGNQVYTTGNVDEMTRNTQTTPLALKIENRVVPELPTPNLAWGPRENLNAALQGAIAEASLWSRPASDVQGSPGLLNPAIGADEKIAALPEVPAIKITQVQSDRDQVTIPPPPPKLDLAALAAAAAGAGGAAETMMPRNADPAAYRAAMLARLNAAPARLVAPANENPADPQATTPVDKYWVTVFGKFSEAELDAAFRKAKIPPFLDQKAYLLLQLVRQELMPDRSWGNEKEIPPLPMNAPPVPMSIDVSLFLDWALRPESTILIVQPPFYQTLANRWMGGPPVKAIAEETTVPLETFDPVTIAQQIRQLPKKEADALRATLTPEQKRKVYLAEQELKAQEAKEKAATKTPPRTTGQPPRSTFTPRGGERGPRDARDPAVLRDMLAQAAPPPDGGFAPPPAWVRTPGYTGRPNYGANPPGSRGAPGMYLRPGYPAANQPQQVNVVRPGERNAAGASLDFDVWAHDDTVEPGQTYRYKMRLCVKNPVYGTNMAKEPAMAKPLLLPVDKDKSWSDWTKPVEVKPRVQFFLAGGAVQGNAMVRIDLYRWQNGKMNKPAQAIAVTPGDIVGFLDKASGIDYNTGLTVVDIRPVGSSDTRVTLVDDNGAQKVRTLKADSSDPMRKEAEQGVAKSKAEIDPATGAVVAPAPGVGAGAANPAPTNPQPQRPGTGGRPSYLPPE